MHPIGPELPISAHVFRQLNVLHASHTLVQATVGVGTVIIVYIGVAYTRGGGVQCMDACCGRIPNFCAIMQMWSIAVSNTLLDTCFHAWVGGYSCQALHKLLLMLSMLYVLLAAGRLHAARPNWVAQRPV